MFCVTQSLSLSKVGTYFHLLYFIFYNFQYSSCDFSRQFHHRLSLNSCLTTFSLDVLFLSFIWQSVSYYSHGYVFCHSFFMLISDCFLIFAPIVLFFYPRFHRYFLICRSISQRLFCCFRFCYPPQSLCLARIGQCFHGISLYWSYRSFEQCSFHFRCQVFLSTNSGVQTFGCSVCFIHSLSNFFCQFSVTV